MNEASKWMRALLSILVICGAATIFFSCNNSNTDSTPTGEWYKQSDFDGVVRNGAVEFMIGDKPYIGLGFTTPINNTTGVFLQDFYAFDTEHNSWKAIAPFPGTARYYAVAFSANGKGYVGLGADKVGYLKDFYEYDPQTDTWTQIADFPSARRGSVAFSIDNKGFVGGGFDGGSYYKDFYTYDKDSNTWVEKASVGGSKRSDAFSFVIDGKAYVGGGVNNTSLDQTFYEYDPLSDVWTVKNDLQDDSRDTDVNDKGYTIARYYAVTFVINGKGYVVGGLRSSTDLQTWEYTPATDTWLVKNPFEGPGRYAAVGYAIGDYGYIATGKSGSANLDDIWQFDPLAIDQP